ncbi:MAG: hypothetical protein M3H12_01165, partial [Chromatiales bacterium]
MKNITPSFTIAQTEMKIAHQFRHLWCVISSDAKTRQRNRQQAVQGKQRLWQTVQACLEQPQPRNRYKSRAVVLATILFDPESRGTYRRHVRILEQF